MKKLLLPAVITIISGCSQKVTIHNDLFFDNLKGPVIKTEQIPFILDSVGKTSDMDSCCISVLEYDNKGFRTKQLDKDAGGNEKSGQIYTARFDNGHAKEIRFMADGKIVNILNGTLTKTGDYNRSQVRDLSGKLISFYDSVEVNDFGKIIVMKSFAADSTLLHTIINNYERQIWIGGIIKDGKGKEIMSTKIKINDKLDPEETIQTSLINDQLVTTVTRHLYNSYDQYGNWIESTETDETGKAKKILKRRIIYRDK